MIYTNSYYDENPTLPAVFTDVICRNKVNAKDKAQCAGQLVSFSARRQAAEQTEHPVAASKYLLVCRYLILKEANRCRVAFASK